MGPRISRANVLLALAMIGLVTIAGPVGAQEGGWERDGLAGHQVRALAQMREPGQMVGLVGGAREPTPLWRRDARGWSQQTTEAPGFVLTLASLPDGGVLLGTGRDIADRPGVFWVGGEPSETRHLYDVQAIGVLVVAPGATGPASAVYAATAPWADRDADSSLLRWDTNEGTWNPALDGTLSCDGMPSYFKDVLTTPSAPHTVLALEACPGAGRRTTQLWRSDDDGNSWQVLPSDGTAGLRIIAVAIDPTNHQTLYRAEAGRGTMTALGVKRSLDGGHTWTAVGDTEDGAPNVHLLAVDPGDPRRLVAATERDGVYLSPDRGETWQPLAGLTDLRIWALAIDASRARLYAATSDGIWRMALP